MIFAFRDSMVIVVPLAEMVAQDQGVLKEIQEIKDHLEQLYDIIVCCWSIIFNNIFCIK